MNARIEHHASRDPLMSLVRRNFLAGAPPPPNGTPKKQIPPGGGTYPKACAAEVGTARLVLGVGVRRGGGVMRERE
jgi:hypothetical protein